MRAMRTFMGYMGFFVVASISFTPFGTRAQVSLEICPPVQPPNQPRQQIAGANAQPGRCYFCGQADKYKADDYTINNLPDSTWPSHGVPYLTEDPNSPQPGGYVDCGNNVSGQLWSPDALEKAEIRGWIVNLPGPHPGEDEYELDVLLDVGWTPDAPEVNAVSDVNVLAQFMTPANIAYMGFGPTVPVRPGPGQLFAARAGTSELNTDSATWGGFNTTVVHIEIDGWGPNRGACDTTVGAQVGGCSYDYNGIPIQCDVTCPDWDYHAHAPANWQYDPCTGVYWPFPLIDPTAACDSSNPLSNQRTFQYGQYVRLVGTLWKDNVHHNTSNIPPPIQAALDCWDSESTSSLGWQEMHNVDYMEVIDPSPVITHVVAGYAICMDTAGQHAEIHDSFSMGPKPFPNSYLLATETNYGGLINWSTMDYPYNDLTSPAMRVHTGLINSTDYGVFVDLSSTATSSARGLFNAYYDAHWACLPECTNRCAGESDGCGGICASSNCSPGYACSNGTCVCAPTTCAAQNKNCGIISDGCSGSLTCGNCSGYQTCGGGGSPNVCGCTPTTCAAQGKNCGTIADGCGSNLTCGNCSGYQTCGGGGSPNVCGCTPTTCAAQGKNCGTIADGCGSNLTCGTCSGNQTCGGGGTVNVCGCTAGYSLCIGQCVDESSDVNHCGSCYACPFVNHETVMCSGGTCAYACATGYHDCGDGNCISNSIHCQ